jgi:hypothetical protein
MKEALGFVHTAGALPVDACGEPSPSRRGGRGDCIRSRLVHNSLRREIDPVVWKTPRTTGDRARLSKYRVLLALRHMLVSADETGSMYDVHRLWRTASSCAFVSYIRAGVVTLCLLPIQTES